MTASEIKKRSLQLGFLGCGIIPAGTIDEYTRQLDERVKSFPGSKELYEPLYGMIHLPETAKSIIVCTTRYNKYKIPDSLKGRIGKCYLFDSRIQYSHDYRAKTEFEEYLKLGGSNILRCNVPARLSAAKAGLGKFGHNNFIYSREHGSYLWIDTWVIDRELEYDSADGSIHLSECENCDKCIRACPTKALSGDKSMDRGKCITQFVCYAKNTLDENTRSQMGSWLYGCDVCQDACPLNKGKFAESEEYPLLAEFGEYLQPENILAMDEDTFLNTVYPRFWYGGKESLWRWKCNALRSLINSGNGKNNRLIKKYCDHEDIRVREIAQWGCRKLGIAVR